MLETKLPRLLAAAREFNVGQETIVDFLVSKGFNRDELKPSARLSEEMYRSLQQEFQSDKMAKSKADQIEIPKAAGSVERKKKEEEEVVFKKEELKIEKQPEPQDDWASPQPVAETKEEEQPVATEPEPVEDVEQQAEPETPVIKVEAPSIQGLKTVGKIDLSTIDSSTRPKKAARKQEEVSEPTTEETTEQPTVETAIEVKDQEIAEEIKEETTPEPLEAATEDIPVVDEVAEKPLDVSTEAEETVESPVEPAPSEVPDEQVVIENIRAQKLEGPKILGKIKLPVDSDTRPKPVKSDEKRKRKRIPIDKKADQKPGEGRHIHPQRKTAQTGTPGEQNRERRPGLTIQKAGDKPQHRQGRDQRRGRDHRREEKEIDQKEIQDKIRETQAKLAGSGGRGKSMKARHRREKRQEAAEAMGEMQDDNLLQVTEFVTVSDLANLMDVNFTDVISKCMNLGIMVSINQRLDAEVIELVAGEFGYEVEFIGLEDHEEEEEEEIDDEENMVPRSPIVTIMGHVDHGKTSLLDYIRNANVVAGEAGGITQHIGAYEVTLSNGKKITFLDTPGHEAFTAMRARGAKVTDLAVIVIAADDAVMPQTREAISHAQAAGVPMIFAINKIDKEGANPPKIYEQLAQMNILVEEWGGKFQSQELSAKKGLNVDLLQEKILLEAELLDLKANPSREASGTIIEASLDKGRGYVATLLVLNGTLKVGDLIVSGPYYGRVKAMFNERNQRVESAPPSTPVQILGLNGAPQAGEKIKVYADESDAKNAALKRAQILREQGLRARKHITLDEIGRRLALGNFKELNLIIKGDVDGSVEALSDSLQKLSTDEIIVSVVHKGVGQISESDVLLATASDAVIVGFNVRPSVQAARLADTEGVEIKLYSIIYNAIEEIKSAMEGMLEPKIQERITANVEIREVYKFDKATVAGCQVLDGKINRKDKVRLIRDGIVVYPTGEGASAELGSLKRYKDDVKEVAAGMECGLTIKNYNDLKVGDIVEAYEEEEIKRTL